MGMSFSSMVGKMTAFFFELFFAHRSMLVVKSWIVEENVPNLFPEDSMIL